MKFKLGLNWEINLFPGKYGRRRWAHTHTQAARRDNGGVNKLVPKLEINATFKMHCNLYLIITKMQMRNEALTAIKGKYADVFACVQNTWIEYFMSVDWFGFPIYLIASPNSTIDLCSRMKPFQLQCDIEYLMVHLAITSVYISGSIENYNTHYLIT